MMSFRDQLVDVLNKCQYDMTSQAQLIKSLQKIYHQMDSELFFQVFFQLLKYSLIIIKREPAVEKTLDLAAKFMTSFIQNDNDKAGAVDLDPVLQKSLEFFIEHHNAQDKAVRYRCCQMINKLFDNMGDDADIDDDLYTKIFDCMLQRLRDKYPAVRIQAVFALSRLQDPTDNDCPITNAYLFLIYNDPIADVRRMTLYNLAASTKSLPAMLDRTLDVNPKVQCLAYDVLSRKVHIRALTIAQRIKLMQRGLNEREESVRDACSNKLLETWLKTFDGNIVQLLKCFDVENSVEVCEKMLQVLFSKTPIKELVKFELINNSLLIPKEDLNCENVFYWQNLCKFIKSKGSSYEEYLDKVLPTAVLFSGYIQNQLSEIDLEEDIEEQFHKEFILNQLLSLASHTDLSDEAGRRDLDKLARNMFLNEKISHSIIKSIFTLYTALNPLTDACIVNLVEIISEIREPNLPQDEEFLHQNNMKVASIRVKINEYRELLEKCVSEQDFTQAEIFKQEISKLDQEKQSLLNQCVPNSQGVEKNDSQTIIKCLTVAWHILKSPSCMTLLPCIQTLLDSLILSGVQCADPAVRNLAIRCLGLACLLNKKTSSDHLFLLLQACKIDTDVIRVTALRAIFDNLMTHGLEILKISSLENSKDTGDDEENEAATVDDDDESISSTSPKSSPDSPTPNRTAANVLNILLDMLDTESSDVRSVAAEGLAKLMVNSHICSHKLFSRLLLLWFNPITEDDTQLRHCLGVFFPLFAFSSRANQIVVEESFMLCLETVINAPSTSPLSEIDISNMSDLLVQLTSNRHLKISQNTVVPDLCSHDNIAILLCNYILEEPNSFNVRHFCKILNSLNLSSNATSNLKDLNLLCLKMSKVVKDKQSLKYLEKFSSVISEMLKTSADFLQSPLATQSRTPMQVHANNLSTISEQPTILEPAPENICTPVGKQRKSLRLKSSTTLNISKANKSRNPPSTKTKKTGNKPRLQFVEGLQQNDDVFVSPDALSDGSDRTHNRSIHSKSIHSTVSSINWDEIIESDDSDVISNKDVRKKSLNVSQLDNKRQMRSKSGNGRKPLDDLNNSVK